MSVLRQLNGAFHFLDKRFAKKALGNTYNLGLLATRSSLLWLLPQCCPRVQVNDRGNLFVTSWSSFSVTSHVHQANPELEEMTNTGQLYN